jgi:hypothetical protein
MEAAECRMEADGILFYGNTRSVEHGTACVKEPRKLSEEQCWKIVSPSVVWHTLQ